MGRKKKYGSEAERQKAYRKRKSKKQRIEEKKQFKQEKDAEMTEKFSERKCEVCGKILSSRQTKYCSYECRTKGSMGIEKPLVSVDAKGSGCEGWVSMDCPLTKSEIECIESNGSPYDYAELFRQANASLWRQRNKDGDGYLPKWYDVFCEDHKNVKKGTWEWHDLLQDEWKRDFGNYFSKRWSILYKKRRWKEYND